MSLLLKAPDPGLSRQAGYLMLGELRKPWIAGYTVFRGCTVPVARTRLSRGDRLGGIKARWGYGRMRYGVLPGLYAVGAPDGNSQAFATANYKMSFDALRSSLDGLDAWMLVLDTDGVNVWCAAGKGSFGTEELAARIKSARLAGIVDHREIILPQLGAPGVSAPEVAKRSGFRVTWGPVRARDIKAWLAAGKKKDEAMRTVAFGLRDRLAVAPVEIVHAWPIVPASLALGALYGLPPGGDWLKDALPATALLLGTLPVGTALFPALLPWLPGRAFVVKGGLLGALWALAAGLAFTMPIEAIAACVLVSAPVSGFLAMNFTGASTYTSQPGALVEVEKGFWPMIVSLAAGLGLAIVSRALGR